MYDDLNEIFSKKNFVLKLQALFQSAQHLYEKREESGSVPQITDPDAPKVYLRILRIRII